MSRINLRTHVLYVLAALIAHSAAVREVSARQYNIPDGDVPALIEAISRANVRPGPSTINLAQGGSYVIPRAINSTLGASGLPVFKSEIVINGNESSITRLTGSSAFRIITIDATSETTLNSLTIAGGRLTQSNSEGGGIRNLGSLVLSDCVISDNQADGTGGGVSNDSGTVVFSNCEISDNVSFGKGGGGIESHGFSGTVTATDSTIIRNSAPDGGGGGIRGLDSSITFTNCTVSQNSSRRGGGGIASTANFQGTGCEIFDNKANGEGGGVAAGGSLVSLFSMSDCIVRDNDGHNGGGLALRGPSRLTGCTVSGNDGSNGGGVWTSWGSVDLINCVINDNTGGTGGGLFNTGNTVSVVGCEISSNLASSHGGGIYNTAEVTLTVRTTTIRDNISNSQDFGGGGVFNYGLMSLTGSTIEGNFAVKSGGAITNFGVLVCTNSTLSGNSTDTFGGAIRNGEQYTPSNATLINVTINGNFAVLGGGIYSDTGGVMITNSVVANSLGGGEVHGSYVDGGHNIIEDGVGLTMPSSHGGDPNLGPLTDNGGVTATHALLSGSIAIDAGDCSAGSVTADQRGVPRPQRATCDIGAYEADCYADCDQSSGAWTLDIFDFLCFQNSFVGGEPYACDCDTSTGQGICDVFDFLCFQDAFVGGCP